MIRCDVYESSNETRLRIKTDDDADLDKIIGCFSSICDRSFDRCELIDACGALASSSVKIYISVSDRGDERLLIERSPGGCAVRWAMTNAGWHNALGLVQGLREGGSGHQYFGSLGADDLVIEISFCE